MLTIDEAAEALLTDAIAQDVVDADDLGLPEETLRALIAVGEASGPTTAWDAQAAREEMRRRFAAPFAGL